MLAAVNGPTGLFLELEPSIFPVFDHGFSFDQLLEQMDCQSVHRYFTAENFPLIRDGQKYRELHLARVLGGSAHLSAEQVTEAVAANNMVCVGTLELMLFAAAFRRQQSRFPIVALGTTWRHKDTGDKSSPYIGENHERHRSVGPLLHVGKFDQYIRFLVKYAS